MFKFLKKLLINPSQKLIASSWSCLTKTESQDEFTAAKNSLRSLKKLASTAVIKFKFTREADKEDSFVKLSPMKKAVPSMTHPTFSN